MWETARLILYFTQITAEGTGMKKQRMEAARIWKRRLSLE